MKKTVCVLTATRAEYGLLKNVIKLFNQDEEIELNIAVTGMHLSQEYGLTFKEIENDGYAIDVKIPILTSENTALAVSNAMGKAICGFAEYFIRKRPDVLVVLGDRYETLAVCIAAMNEKIPVAHIHGGEITEGAIDDAIRHAITKMSYLHFTSAEEYRRRVIQLGEAPERVFYVGAPGVENVLSEELLGKEELETSLGIDLSKPYFVCTFHPVTLEDISETEKQIEDLLKIACNHKEYSWIFTKANADAGGKIINEKLDKMAIEAENVFVFTSLGLKRYLSALKYSSGVVGNTSSGILEAPSFKIPTINIGDRQKGRIQATSIVNCKPNYESIENALNIIEAKDFKEKIVQVNNPYEHMGTSLAIYEKIKEFLEEVPDGAYKKFYDIEVNEC